MHTENQLLMRASAGRIFALARDVARWPDILPHYRWVRVIEQVGNRTRAEMAARRGHVPVYWVADEMVFPEEPRITFRHIAGVTRGMEVEWRFDALPEGTLVTISHELRLAWPVVGRVVAQRIIGPHFVAAIAGETLAHIRALAEAEERRATLR